MPTSVLYVLPEVAGRTSRAEIVIGPGDPVAGGVVLATVESIGAWNAAQQAAAAWIVVGDGPLPSSFRPFLMLPATASGTPVELAVDAACELLRLRERAEIERAEATHARERQLELARVGIALSAERDLDRLLELILSTARGLVGADAGSLYLIEEVDGERVLRFVLAQNDSVAAPLVTTTMPLDRSSLAGWVALSGEPVSVEDAHGLSADVPYRLNLAFDLATGYHTRSVLSAPMATRAGEVIGVLQLINRKLDPQARILEAATADAVVRPFGAGEVAVIRALAAQAAVAIENSRLVREIERLFEGFVRASVTAIEQRDPSTSGHSLRVAHYTLGLARALEENPPPRFGVVSFTRDELTQLRYAALLHDFGKVGVREAVLTKARKLFPERLALLEERFRHARRAREVQLLRQFLRMIVDHGRAPSSEELAALDAAVSGEGARLAEQLSAVLRADEPSVLESATAHLLAQVGHERLPLDDGDEPLVFPEDLRALSVPRGSLGQEERQEMESHVIHSYQFLLTLPWPQRLGRVPAIAYGHHEKLNGRGYPCRLLGEQIPTEVRLMTVADIYDALTAGDRPYKPAVSPERALGILDDEARLGFLDQDLVRLFIQARVWTRPSAEALAI